MQKSLTTKFRFDICWTEYSCICIMLSADLQNNLLSLRLTLFHRPKNMFQEHDFNTLRLRMNKVCMYNEVSFPDSIMEDNFS